MLIRLEYDINPEKRDPNLYKYTKGYLIKNGREPILDIKHAYGWD